MPNKRLFRVAALVLSMAAAGSSVFGAAPMSSPRHSSTVKAVDSSSSSPVATLLRERLAATLQLLRAWLVPGPVELIHTNGLSDDPDPVGSNAGGSAGDEPSGNRQPPSDGGQPSGEGQGMFHPQPAH